MGPGGRGLGTRFSYIPSIALLQTHIPFCLTRGLDATHTALPSTPIYPCLTRCQARRLHSPVAAAFKRQGRQSIVGAPARVTASRLLLLDLRRKGCPLLPHRPEHRRSGGFHRRRRRRRPWASSRRPRHHIRRRLRRATRCVGAFAAAPAQHARALSAIDSCCGHELARA
jgi:hypothetical protein